jgi:hypothetical protein
MAVTAVRRLEAMAIQLSTDEANIRQRINRWVEALCTMDLEGVMSLYAPDIVSFDLVPPLRHVGAKAKEKNWANAFAMFQRPLDYEIRDLTLTLGDDVAFGLARYFGFSPEYWFNMQAHYDLETIRRQSIGKIEREIKPREAA